jgi:preprotein translocase subunit SecE
MVAGLAGGARTAVASYEWMKTAMLDNLKETPEHAANWFGRARQFLAEVRAELGRVTWPTRREVWATTVVVILISLLIGIYLYVVDLGLSQLVLFIFDRVGR